MNRKTTFSLAAAVTALTIALNTSIAGTYVLDPQSVSWPDSNDILTDHGPFATLPRLAVSSAALGLQATDVIDALSDGDDKIGAITVQQPDDPVDPGGADGGVGNDGPDVEPIPLVVESLHGLLFSVRRSSNGGAGTGVRDERVADSVFPPGGNPFGHASDLFRWTGTAGMNELAPAPDGWRGDNGDESNARLRIPNGDPGDNVSAYDERSFRMMILPGGGGLVPNDDNDGPGAAGGVPFLPRPIFFSLRPSSPTLALIGAAPGDILVVGGPFGATPAIFLTTAQLGIPATADIDSLSLNVSVLPNGSIVANAARFTVSSGTAGFALPGGAVNSGADVIYFDGAASSLEFTHGQIGLLPGDDVDALESGAYRHDIFGLVPLGDSLVVPGDLGIAVTEIGASGQDGVAIDVGETTRWDGSLQFPQGLPGDTSIEFAAHGATSEVSSDGSAGSSPVASWRLAHSLNYTEVEWTYLYASCRGALVVAFRESEAVFASQGIQSGEVSFSFDGNRGDLDVSLGLVPLPLPTGAIGAGIGIGFEIQLGGQEGEDVRIGDETVRANRVVVLGLCNNENLPLEAISRVDIRAAGAPALLINSAASRDALINSQVHDALGRAQLTRDPNGLVVSAIGSSGIDGVRIGDSGLDGVDIAGSELGLAAQGPDGGAGDGGGAMTARRSLRTSFRNLRITAEDGWMLPTAIIAVELDAGAHTPSDPDLEAAFRGLDEDTTVARFFTGSPGAVELSCFLSEGSLTEPVHVSMIEERQFVRFEGSLEIVDSEVTPNGFRFRFAATVRYVDEENETLVACDVIEVVRAAGEVDEHNGIAHVDITASDLESFTILRQATDVEPREVFRRGDADGNGTLELTDAVRTLGFLFLGLSAPECADAADSNDDGRVDIGDAVNSLNVLFLGTGSVPAPGTELCGIDPTGDTLGCESYDVCE